MDRGPGWGAQTGSQAEWFPALSWGLKWPIGTQCALRFALAKSGRSKVWADEAGHF